MAALLPVAAATVTAVGDSATSVAVAAANGARRGLLVHNDSAATLYLKYGATASTVSFSLKLAPGELWSMPTPIYGGQIDGIWSSDAGGNALVTEW